jgi:uncharacterized protein with HEPN domain
MSQRSDHLRLADMLTADREARQFAEGKSTATLLRDRQLTLALLKCVEIIGEAAGRVEEETRAKYPHVPWADMIGMRNRLIHTYFDVDLALLWTTVTDDLPELIRQLEPIVEAKAPS